MWFLPLLVLGAIVVAAASKSPRETALPARQLAAPPPPPIPPTRAMVGGSVPGVPGPISVLGEILRVGQYPSNMVILCALAEAQAIGRADLADDIVKAFIAPGAPGRRAARGRASSYQRGSCALPRSPRGTGSVMQPPINTAAFPSPMAAPSMPPFGPPMVPAFDPSGLRGYPAHPSHGPMMETQIYPPPSVPVAANQAAPPVQAPQVAPPTAPKGSAQASQGMSADSAAPISSEEDYLALLHTDPAAFIATAQQAHAQPRAQVVVYPAGQPPRDLAPRQEAPPTALPPEVMAQMQDDAGQHQAADHTRAMAPGSPLGGVSDEAWRQFVVRLSREQPSFDSSRHVGQFRQRKERLAELGIDPRTIHGSAQAQRAALDTDLADAHNHAVAGGVLAAHLGRSVVLPGRDAPETLTLSGLLGVIQCAGLDGAVGWLERTSDRKRYPHTTQAFVQTNNLF